MESNTRVVELIDSLGSQVLTSDIRIETYRSLRASEKSLLEDVRYITMIIQNAGREYLELVNQIELIEIEGHSDSVPYQTKVIELYKLIHKITKQLLTCFDPS